MDFKTKYFAIWQEVWGLHKKYWSIPADDTNSWKEFISAMGETVGVGVRRLGADA